MVHRSILLEVIFFGKKKTTGRQLSPISCPFNFCPSSSKGFVSFYLCLGFFLMRYIIWKLFLPRSKRNTNFGNLELISWSNPAYLVELPITPNLGSFWWFSIFSLYKGNGLNEDYMYCILMVCLFALRYIWIKYIKFSTEMYLIIK